MMEAIVVGWTYLFFFLKLFEYDVSPQLWWLGLARG